MNSADHLVPEVTEDEYATNPKYRAVFALMQLLGEDPNWTRPEKMEFAVLFAQKFDNVNEETLRVGYRYTQSIAGQAQAETMWQEFDAWLHQEEQNNK